MNRSPIEPPANLAELYNQVDQTELGRRCGVSRFVVRRWLREAGISVRPEGQIHKEWMAKQSREDKLRTTQASRALIKGQPRSQEWHRKRALGVQRVGRMSANEQYVFEYVRQYLGYDPVPQKAVGKFNIDLALPRYLLAIEVDGGLWHTRHSPRKAALDRAKEEFLALLGWQVVRIRARNSGTLNRDLETLRQLLELKRPT